MFTNIIKRLSWNSHRIIATILVFCMVFETGAMHVYAAEYEFDHTVTSELIDIEDYENSPNNPETDNNNGDPNEASNDTDTNPDSNSSDSSINEQENSDDNSGENNAESSDTDVVTPENDEEHESSETDKDADSNEVNDDVESGKSNNNEFNGSNGAESIENDDNEYNENNNDVESTKSDDALNSVEFIDIADAEKAFANIVSAKDVMALIYMTNTYHVRCLADADSDTVADLESGHTVYLLGVTINPGKVWFRVQFWVNGVQMEGYVERSYLAYSDEDWLKWDKEYLYKLADNGLITQSAIGGIKTLALSYTDVSQFPAGYQDALTKLKSAHPNWIFVPMNTGLDFESAISNEMGDKSLIQNTTNNSSNGWVGSACPTESGWYYATRDAVAYHMDPRNFLTESYIFQFEQLTFNSSYHTVDAIQSFLNSTFMKGTLPDDSQKRTYAQAFYEIGSARKLSPIHLASRVYLEQGQGNSGLISGTYPGYEGYYNYFNVNVNGSSEAEKIEKGLKYAKEQGWNTRYKSLEGGAATIGNNYILKGQDTIYLEKFNVEKNSPYGLYNHQYMQNIQAPASESSTSKKMYSNTGSLDSAFVFKIPVYNNMTEPQPLLGISLNKESITLRRPDTVVADDSSLDEDAKSKNVSSAVLQVIFDPEDTTDDRTIVWTSSNKKVATVENGVVTAVGAGETTITATASHAGNQTATCKVTVIAPVYKIEFSSENNTDSILVGQSVNLSAEYFPKDTTSDTTVRWTSSDTSVIIIDDETKGAVRGVSAGTAEVTATIGGYSAGHRITVENCNVTFMDVDNTTSIMTLSTAYGETIPQTTFDTIQDRISSADDSIFMGWYTGPDGTGSIFNSATSIHQKETKVYPYFIKRGSGFYVIPIGDQIYTGSAIKPDIVVYDMAVYEDIKEKDADINDSDVEDADKKDTNIKDFDIEDARLALNKDYTISYKNNKKAASADCAKPPTITIKGKGNYDGTQTITFNILPKALTDTDITCENITEAYTGKTIKSSPTLYRDGKKLTKNTDYKLTYPQTGSGAYQSAGTYPIIITGNGGYSGTLTVYETISKKTLLSKVKIAKIPAQAYDSKIINKENGTGIEPQLTVTYKNTPLVESTDGGVTGDYVVSYKNNFDIGTATATITATANSENFTGSKSITFKITGTSISKAVIEGVESKTYTGMEEDVMQDADKLSVSLNGEKLNLSKDNGKTGDYIIEYKNTHKTGTATVIIKGINSYTGTKKATYKINAYDLSQIDMSNIIIKYCDEGRDGNVEDNYKTANKLNDITTPYVKGGTKPSLKLYYKIAGNDKETGSGTETDNFREMEPGKDYTVKYKNNNAVTTSDIAEDKLPLITITGKGNFKGKLSDTFRITDGAMSDDNSKITMTAKDVIFKDKQGFYKTSVTLTDANGKKLQAGKDYDKTLHYTYVNKTSLTTVQGENITRDADEEVNENDIPNVGTAIRITVTGIGAYAGTSTNPGSKSAIYYIAAVDISKAKVTVTTKNYDNGRPVTLTKDDITVTLNGENLVLGKDYAIETDTYVRNYTKGKASVTIRGTGTHYGGTKKVNFTIKGKILSWL